MIVKRIHTKDVMENNLNGCSRWVVEWYGRSLVEYPDF
jgi:hypothetical protein